MSTPDAPLAEGEAERTVAEDCWQQRISTGA